MSQTDDHTTLNGVVLPLRPRPHDGQGEPEQAPTPPVDEPQQVELVDRVHLDEPADDEGLVGKLRSRRDEVQPVVPLWLRSRADVLAVMRLSGELAARRIGYQAVRVPYYWARLAGQSPRGLGRIVTATLRWAFDWNAWQQSRDASGRGDFDRAFALAEQRGNRVKARLSVLAAAAFVLVLVGILVAATAPTWAQWSALAVLLAVLGAAGGKQDRPVFTRAVVPARVEPLTSDVVLRGLAATGISALAKKASIEFRAPIMRDGPGWRAEVDLPYGVTADSVIEKRKELAAGLRRPMGCVWPEPVTEEHPGRLVLWVGDVELRKSKQPAWPLAKKGQVDLFDAVPYGNDVRGRWVPVTLMYASIVIGSIPRMGKTFLLRLLLLIAALDPRAELHLYDLKGTGDLSPLQSVAHRYRAGDDEDDIEYAVASMRELREELRRRTKVVRELPKDVCPENKVTSALASMRHLRLHPIVVGVDECQVWFEHKVYGAELEEICTDIVKRGPALGMIPLYATQRPDAKSLPTGISANAVLRFALKVMGHTENDMVLGSGMNRAGYKAQTFTRKDLGIHYLAGEGDDPRIVRSVYVDAPTAERIAERARQMREAAGTLSGYALGQEDSPQESVRFDLLQDVAGVLTEDRAWSETVISRLAELRPDAYGDLTPAMLASRLKPYGIETVQMELRGPDGRRANRRGLVRADVLEVLAARDAAR